jgi:hypothetical protein
MILAAITFQLGIHSIPIAHPTSHSFKMCQQVKMGYTLCPHVACDLYVLPCIQGDDQVLCMYKTTGDLNEYVWLETREIGKCLFCMLEESDKKEKRKKKRRHYECWI